MNSRESLDIWTVFDHPRDMPDHFVARKSMVMMGGGTIITDEVVLSTDLEELRLQMAERGLTVIGRYPEDDPKIVEVWL